MIPILNNHWATIGAGIAALPTLFVAIQEPSVPNQAPQTSTAGRLTVENFDAMFAQAWTAAGLDPAQPASDAEWLRRASLSLNGSIPTAEEMAAFLAEPSYAKRAKKVNELIERKDFGEHFGGEWERKLTGRAARGQRYFDRAAFSQWCVDQFNNNIPFSDFTKSLLTASGSADDNPAAGYMMRWEAEPKDLAGQTAKSFLSIQIQCARCHDHKDQQWKKDEFNEFAAHFALTRVRRVGEENGRPVGEVVDEPEPKMGKAAQNIAKKAIEKRAKQIKNPERAQKMMEQAELRLVHPAPLRPLDEGPFVSVPPPSMVDDAGDTQDTSVEPSRRESLAAWMTAPGNPYFSRSIVNTTFDQLFGYGMVNPSDDFRSDSTIAIPPMLDALAKEFEASAFNFKDLVRLLASSKAFGLASAGNIKEKPEARESHEKVFARYPMRPMTPEQLFDSIVKATGIDEASEERAKRSKGRAKGKNKAPEQMGEKMAEAYGRIRQTALRRFVTTFEDDDAAEEVTFEGTVPQALLMMNSKIITESIGKGTTLQRVLDRNNDKIDWLYLTILSRKPTGDERAKVAAYSQRNGGESRETFEDLVWVLINSAEFSTIH